jgi:4-hydroxyphenylpyruvate dioxygenase
MSVSAQPARSVPQADAPARTALATVCLSGTLEDKLGAAASAGFDGVEIFEPDFVAAPFPAAEVRHRCADLGLSIDLYQPFRDFDSTDPQRLAANLRRAERKFDVMAELGTDLVLVCSSVAPDALDDDDRIAAQLHTLAERAAERGLRVSYEALAWGRHVNTYDRSWEIVRRADHPALGLCLDSFHILSRGSDPAGIRGIPGEKLFFLQLADAPHLDMNVLQWSRHHRLFPGQGAFDLPAFLGHVLAAGYSGPLSLEVFNDVFRQADPRRAAVDALRSLLALQEATRIRLADDPGGERVPVGATLPPTPELRGVAFVELAVDDECGPPVARTLAALGLERTGEHRSKPVQLWSSGEARVLLNARPPGLNSSGPSGHGAAVAAVGVEVADPAAAAARAAALLAPALPRTRGPAEADLSAVAAPDGTQVFFCRTGSGGSGGWLSDFPGEAATAQGGITHVDHVALTQPFDNFDEAVLFYRSLLGLETQHASEVAAPFGLVRNRTVADPARTVRLGLSVSVLRRGEWGPGVSEPQHVAFACDDVPAAARAARAAGAPLLPIPDNYYDDLDARLAPPPELLRAMRELGVLLDRDEHGEFLHFYTEVLGARVFFEVVQRIGGYEGYGEINAPIRMAAHRRLRLGAPVRATPAEDPGIA